MNDRALDADELVALYVPEEVRGGERVRFRVLPPSPPPAPGASLGPVLTATRISQAGQRRYTIVVPEPVPPSRLLAVEVEGQRCILELPIACGPGQTLACAPALTAALTAGAGGEGEGEGDTPEGHAAEEFDVPLPAEVMAGQVLNAHSLMASDGL